MISYIVALYRSDVYEIMAGPCLRQQELMYDAQVILVEGAESIYAAYEEGRQRAEHYTHVYVHDDAAILELDATPKILQEFRNRQAQLMGVVGARGEKLPWWTNEHLMGGWAGIRRDKRLWWNYGASGATLAEQYNGTQRPIENRQTRAKYDDLSVDWLDGIFLAEQTDLPWPEREAGLWHGYDAERCLQVRKAGGSVKLCDVAVAHWNQRHGKGHMEGHAKVMAQLREEI